MSWPLVAFLGGFLALVVLDLAVLHRRPSVPTFRTALGWTIVWVVAGLGFAGVIYAVYDQHLAGAGLERSDEVVSGPHAAAQYLAGYVTEKILNLDILFVIAAIFSVLHIRPEHRHRVLFWGLFGVVFIRTGMILAGVGLLSLAGWLRFVLGGVLVFAAVRMFTLRFDRVEGQRSRVLRVVQRFARVAPPDERGRFFTRIDGQRAVTPLFVALVMIELSDLVFAIDTIPGVLSVTERFGHPAPVLVLVSSNLTAVLGLRALYSVLESSILRFHYLRTCLSIILLFVAVKMIIAPWYALSPEVSALAILATLALGVVASIIDNRSGREAASAPLGTDMEIRARKALRQARKIVVLVIGSTILLLAIPIGALPGPGGLFVAFAGLAILATEFVWAKIWLNRVKRGARQIQDRALRALGAKPRKPKGKAPGTSTPAPRPEGGTGSRR